MLRRDMDIEVVVAPSLDSVQGVDLVNVVASQTGCNRLVLALRSGPKARVFVLDSDYGPVYLAGGRAYRRIPGRGCRPAEGSRLRQQGVPMRKADGNARLEVNCPDGTHRSAVAWSMRRRWGRWRGRLLALLRAARRAGRVPRHRHLGRPEPEARPRRAGSCSRWSAGRDWFRRPRRTRPPTSTATRAHR